MFLSTESSQNPCGVFRDKQKEILLIVDDDPQVRKMLMRLFKHHFDAAFTAATPADAERILQENKVTHILSDYDLGEENPRGTELIIEWRRRYPLIQRVLLLSGSKLSISKIPDEVDRFIEKGSEPREILEALKSCRA